jgi:tyrosyl-tRNA synthetase
MDEVRKLGALEGAEINQAKIILADEATRLCHGIDAAEKAKATAQTTFGNKGMSDGLHQVTINPTDAASLSVITALNMVGFANSNGEARRLIRGGGAKVNDNPIADEDAVISLVDFQEGKLKMSAGKKRHALIILL